MYVKPREGYKIRDPFKKDFLPVTGREVPDDDTYWMTLLRDKDIELTERPTAPAAPPASPENEEADKPTPVPDAPEVAANSKRKA